ncbi:hypothetical protein V6N11_081782 [Hibiscus sabdariffa]|uniref:Cationic amino acid transporter 6 n=1 Tax=Hibiscus sabdariffa TaxID=183260 RepID=A0ABR2Q7Q2_9ROSI
MLATWTPDQELNQVRLRSGADMKRKLRWYDLVALGMGGMLGVGVFVTTGSVARKTSGPSVFISYIIAGISALLSSLCYTEFSVHIPVAGGAFSYLRVTFGEFVGYFAGANILMEYVLSNAAVARSFTEYLCSAFGVSDPNSWRVEVQGLVEGYNKLDFVAVALVLLLTLCLCHSTKESSILNLIMTIFHVIFFGFIIIVAFYNGSVENLTKPEGIAPHGIRGVLDGAAIVYFSYIGYDSVSTLAEEIQNPPVSLPVGIVGSVLIVSALYCLMALALCMMVPFNQIAEKASYSMAFQTIGWKWAGNVVGAGASMGIVASLLVAMLGQARYLCVIGRARLVPSWLSNVHPSRGTPLNATLFLGRAGVGFGEMALHGNNSTVHGPGHSDRNDLDRHTAGVLPGGQRYNLPKIRAHKPNPTFQNTVLPLPPHIKRHRVLHIMETEAAMVGSATIRRAHGHNDSRVPVHDPLRQRAERVVGAAHALAGGRVHFPQCLPHDNTEDAVVPKVRCVGMFDNRVLFVVRSSFNFRSRRDGEGGGH